MGSLHRIAYRDPVPSPSLLFTSLPVYLWPPMVHCLLGSTGIWAEASLHLPFPPGAAGDLLPSNKRHFDTCIIEKRMENRKRYKIRKNGKQTRLGCCRWLQKRPPSSCLFARHFFFFKQQRTQVEVTIQSWGKDATEVRIGGTRITYDRIRRIGAAGVAGRLLIC